MVKFEPEELAVSQVNHLPIVKAYAKKIQLIETINKMVSSQMRVSIGHVLLAMVMDTLSGRSPLYRLSEFYEDKDTELLLGRTIAPEAFRDHNLGRVLDAVFEVGTVQIFGEIARMAAFHFDIDTRVLHHDTTSISVFGDYEWVDPPFLITYGHSKDKRPDLKQFLVSMLCAEGNIPIFGKTEDGNGSDKTINNTLLTRVSTYMAKHELGEDAFVYIADSAMVTEDNLKQFIGPNRFLTRLPATYSECSRAIHEAVEADKWTQIGAINETPSTSKRPAAIYRAYETRVELYGIRYRAVVYHSSAHDKRRHKRIDRAMSREKKELEKVCKKARAAPFYCKADADVAVSRLMAMGEYHTIRAEIMEIPRFSKGRPGKDGPGTPSRIEYVLSLRIEEDKHKLEPPRLEAGCFVMMTNLADDRERQSYPSEKLLRMYKEQYGVEEKNFGFLKDPVIVNSIFLKKAERIEVLGLILLISLLIWRLIERSLRLHVEKTGKQLPGWDRRKTDRPTAFMMTTKFINILVVKTEKMRRLVRPLKPDQMAYIVALGLSETIFTDP